MSMFFERGSGMGERNDKSGIEAFIRAHQSSGSIGEAAAKLGIDEKKYLNRFSVYNHRLKKAGYEPMFRHSGKITRTDEVFSQLESEGLLRKVGSPKTKPEKPEQTKPEKPEQPNLWDND